MYAYIMQKAYNALYQDTQSYLANKDVLHTGVLFTETAKSPFSIPHISNYLTNLYQIYVFHIHDHKPNLIESAQ